VTGTVGLLLTSQALRGLGYGIAAVQLGAILRFDGLTPAGAGLMPAAILAGEFVVQAYLGYWLSLRHGATTRTLGITFAALGVLQTASLRGSGCCARWCSPTSRPTCCRPPSRSLPGLGGAIALLMARARLSQMDVPIRQAYVLALVREQERTVAAVVTNTARHLTRPAGPALAGFFLPFGLALPFVIAGAAKTAYDLTRSPAPLRGRHDDRSHP
jgi:hypothetical protein